MTEQAYYRLDELPAMGITEGKLRYLLEQQQVTPAFFIHNERFIIGGYLSNKFVGFAVADYSGLVTIHKQLIPELLTKGKVSVKQVLLMQKECIRIIATTYPFQVKMPNHYIESWQPNDLTKLDWQAYPALFMPTENTGVLHQLVDMLQSFGSSTGNNVDYNRFADGTPTTELVVLDKELRFIEVCIQHQNLELNKAIVQSKIIESKKENNTPPSEYLIKHNALDKVLIRILISNRKLSAKPVFKILTNESKIEESLRIFDTEFILLDQIDDLIIWKDSLSKKQEKRCSLATLANKLSNLRKELDHTINSYETNQT